MVRYRLEFILTKDVSTNADLEMVERMALMIAATLPDAKVHAIRDLGRAESGERPVYERVIKNDAVN
jgi:hypothetical protein